MKRFLGNFLFLLIFSFPLYSIEEVGIELGFRYSSFASGVYSVIEEINHNIYDIYNQDSTNTTYSFLNKPFPIGIGTGFRYFWNSMIIKVNIEFEKFIKTSSGWVYNTGKKKNTISFDYAFLMTSVSSGYALFMKGRNKVYIGGGIFGGYLNVYVSQSYTGYDIRIFGASSVSEYSYSISSLGLIVFVGSEFSLFRNITGSLEINWYRGLSFRFELPDGSYTTFEVNDYFLRLLAVYYIEG